MTQTDEPVLILNQAFLVDFGRETGDVAKSTWVTNTKALLKQASPFNVMEVLASGPNGRLVFRIFSPDPSIAVAQLSQLRDGEGPEVQVL
jgi:hypothetical protein